MASVRNEFLIEAAPEDVWDAVRDVGAVHRRLAVGFVTDTRLEGEARIVTFANGITVRELIVDIDDGARRLVWAAVGGRTSHYNASLQIFADGENRSRALWVADFLPNDLLALIHVMVTQGALAIKNTLERQNVGG
jgi:carbon monoxide dehydrogenase subunit G